MLVIFFYKILVGCSTTCIDFVDPFLLNNLALPPLYSIDESRCSDHCAFLKKNKKNLLMLQEAASYSFFT